MRLEPTKKERVPESTIKKHIVEFLKWKKVFCFVVSTTGIFDPKRKTFRTLVGTGQRKGVSDILGIFQGRPIAIEVKAKGGQLSPHQIDFLNDFSAAGGIAIVAFSISDVERCLFTGEIKGNFPKP